MDLSAGKTHPQSDVTGKVPGLILPIFLSAISFLVCLFFLRPTLGDPDSYREALSAVQYVQEGKYGSYWDHALTLYFFVAATHVSFFFKWNHISVLNVLAAFLGSLSVWPFYQLVRRLVNWQTAAFGSVALILSPVLIRLSTYLSHEIAGFTLALWSLYLFERTLAKKSWFPALAFGISVAATWAARPNEAVFIGLPLLVLLFSKANRPDLPVLKTCLIWALLGFAGCLLCIYRPELISRLLDRSNKYLFSEYFVGAYLEDSTWKALTALSPALVALSIGGLLVLVLLRKYFTTLFCASWAFPVYLFFTGVNCRHRYFIAILAPCLLLCFAAADSIDRKFLLGRRPRLHAAKSLALMFLFVAAFGTSLPEMLDLKESRDDEIMSLGIGKHVGNNLLLTTSPKPMIDYYNRDNPPETLYFLESEVFDTVKIDIDDMRRVQYNLEMGIPVFTTDLIIEHLQYAGFEIEFESVWEYKTLKLFRLTKLGTNENGIFGYTYK